MALVLDVPVDGAVLIGDYKIVVRAKNTKRARLAIENVPQDVVIKLIKSPHDVASVETRHGKHSD